MHTYEVWKCSDGSMIWCGHSPERRRHISSPSDLLIGILEVEEGQDVSDAANEAFWEFENHGRSISSAAGFLTESYSNGLFSGAVIEATRDVDPGGKQIPSGTLLRVEQGDADFPEVLYATTIKWPKGRGRDHHLPLVMLSTHGLGAEYRIHRNHNPRANMAADSTAYSRESP